MFGLLVRVGIDQTYGKWNAPVDPESKEFVYVPIPESRKKFMPGMKLIYRDIVFPALDKFCRKHKLDLRSLKFPLKRWKDVMHLDPDFDHLTYGDTNRKRHRRGKKIECYWRKHDSGFIAFFASLEPIKPCKHKLIYALIGFYEIEEVLKAKDVPKARARENAHTRRANYEKTDVIVRAKKMVSGRLEKCIPIGEFRDGSYRVRRDLLKEWGKLSVKNGYIQRSAVLPEFNDPEKFYKWFRQQKVHLLKMNN